MESTIDILVDTLLAPSARCAAVIPWSAPILSFGDVSRAYVATMGLNPSNLEFVDELGHELDGRHRRFHTLSSLGLSDWKEANSVHLGLILECCRDYFVRNPYDTWFGVLNHLIGGLNVSYYGSAPTACHLDLIPYATSQKWSLIPRRERDSLLCDSARILGLLLRDSPVRLLVMNGRSVIRHFESITTSPLRVMPMDSWSLGRTGARAVVGAAFFGIVKEVGGIQLGREVSALGFNHNLQSSFGVTKNVVDRISKWLGRHPLVA